MVNESFTYVDQEGNIHSWIPSTGGPAKLAENKPEDMQLSKDIRGFTHPNLHRRIDPAYPPVADQAVENNTHKVRDNSLYVSSTENQKFMKGELSPREYKLVIGGLHSYRTTKYTLHDEDSTTSEIP